MRTGPDACAFEGSPCLADHRVRIQQAVQLVARTVDRQPFVEVCRVEPRCGRDDPVDWPRGTPGQQVAAGRGSQEKDDRDARNERADGREVLVESGPFVQSARDLEVLVVGVFAGRPVYLREVATVTDGPEEPASYTRIAFGPGAAGDPATDRTGADYPAVTVGVAKRKGSNAVTVARALEAMEGQDRRFNKVDAVVIESGSQLAEPTGAARVRLTLKEAASVEGEVVWADAAFFKIRRADGGPDLLVAKRQVLHLEVLDGTDAAPRDGIQIDAWAARRSDSA